MSRFYIDDIFEGDNEYSFNLKQMTSSGALRKMYLTSPPATTMKWRNWKFFCVLAPKLYYEDDDGSLMKSCNSWNTGKLYNPDGLTMGDVLDRISEVEQQCRGEFLWQDAENTFRFRNFIEPSPQLERRILEESSKPGFDPSLRGALEVREFEMAS